MILKDEIDDCIQSNSLIRLSVLKKFTDNTNDKLNYEKGRC